MHTLDVRTIVFLAGFMGILMSGVLLFLHRSYPHSVRGLHEWSAATVIGVFASLLFGARGLLPDWLTVVVGNLFLIASVATFSIGSRRFFGLDRKLGLFIGIGAAAALPLVWLTVIEPNYPLRLQFMATLMAAIFGHHAWLVHRHGTRTFAVRFTTTVLALQTVILAVRAVWAASLPPDSNLFSPSALQSIYVASYAMTMLTLTIGVILLATERLRSELEYLATHDLLTGLLNRRAFIDAAEQELSRCRRHGHVMSLLVMDLDHFKNINDTYGHLVGDSVIRNFADRVTSLLRRPDRFGRYGGEEFVLLLPETGRESAAVVAERICAAASSAQGVPHYTVSVGLATSIVTDTDIDTVLDRADMALYKAKAGGRNQVAVAPILQEVA